MKTEKRRPQDADDTDRTREKRCCRKHLDDLRRAHLSPPADVPVKRQSTPTHIEPTAPSSYRTSFAQLCSELGE